MSNLATQRPRMCNDAFAGLIRLLLTPLPQLPEPSEDLDAYLAYLNEVEPLDSLMPQPRELAA